MSDTKADDYYNKIYRFTWARRWAGVLTGGTVGAAYGAIIGAVVAFLPYVFGAASIAGAAAVALPGLAAIGASVALFAGMGLFAGIIPAADTSANAAAVAIAMAEKEKGEIHLQGQEPSQALASLQSSTAATSALFSWKQAAFLVPLLAGAGAVLALNPLSASTVALSGFEAGSAAAVSASALVFGMLGGFFSLNGGAVTHKVNQFWVDFVTDRMFEPAQEQNQGAGLQPVTGMAQVPQEPIASKLVNGLAENGKIFASQRLRSPLQSIIEKTEECASNHNVVIR